MSFIQDLKTYLNGLSIKSYKFFAPNVSSTSTVMTESVLVEFARQSGKPVQAITNGLGKCVGYTSSNVAISNGTTKVVGTVIDFASRQVLVTEELAASTAVAGGESVAVGATVTEITATTTTTTMLGTTLLSVAACALAAIGGYEFGKTTGEYLAEEYPDFWVDTCGKALYDGGCTISSFITGKPIITYLDADGNTYLTDKSLTIIKGELIKVGVDFTATPDPNADYSGTTPTTVNLGIPGQTFVNCTFNIPNGYQNTPCLYYTYGQAYYLPKGTYRPCLYLAVAYPNGTKTYSFKAKIDKIVSEGHNAFTAYINGSYEFFYMGSALGSCTFYDGTAINRCTIPIFSSYEAALAYTNTGQITDPAEVVLPEGFFIPAAPVIFPTGNITIVGDPLGDEDAKVIPVPGLEPELNPVAIPSPESDPVTSTEGVAPNPNPFPAPTPDPILEIPEEPPVDPDIPPYVPSPMIASDLSRVFNPTKAQLSSLGEYMWSSSRLEDLMKLFQNPSDGVISLHAIYGVPSVGESAEIKLGYLSTGVNALLVTSQFVIIDCGEINISEKYNNATDYAPYTTVQIYLPFIGVQSLNPFDVVGSSIKCIYKIDVYTGACIAQLNVIRSGLNGVIYEFSGNCAYQIPLTSGNYLQAQANIIAGFIGGGAVGGQAGAILGAGNALLHSNVEVTRSGNLSANAGILGNRIPYFIITRSIPDDAINYSQYYGFPANKTLYLSECSGYTRVKHVILHTSATQEERDEMMKLLKSGVYI